MSGPQAKRVAYTNLVCALRTISEPTRLASFYKIKNTESPIANFFSVGHKSMIAG
jgi:hypothetical protein